MELKAKMLAFFHGWHLYGIILQSKQVKHTPQDSINEMIIILKNESVSGCRIFCQSQISISACVMSSEYLTRTSLY